jgi:DNA polymerase-3 subunit gamma/tau
MRDLMETVAHRPIKGRFKIYIIDEVHMLSQHSFNALLKTLEEPPGYVKFIFATTDPQKVLPTVVSRCQRYDLRRIALDELVAHLGRTVAARERSRPRRCHCSPRADGSLRDAQSLLSRCCAPARPSTTPCCAT